MLTVVPCRQRRNLRDDSYLVDWHLTREDTYGYGAGAYTASFVSLFPAEAPQYVILVKLDNPKGDIFGGKTAAPVSKIVLQAALARDITGYAIVDVYAAFFRTAGLTLGAVVTFSGVCRGAATEGDSSVTDTISAFESS